MAPVQSILDRGTPSFQHLGAGGREQGYSTPVQVADGRDNPGVLDRHQV